MEMIAVTERLLLRTLNENDKDHILRISRQSWWVANFENSELLSTSFKEICWKTETAPGVLPALVFLKDSETLVGRVCMQKMDTLTPEAGIDILPDYRNQGFGPEAMVAFCNWCAEKFSLTKVNVRISQENIHSIHVFEKIGAIYQGATTYLPADVLESLQRELPNSDFGVLLKNSVREYVLELPIR